jgi:hypothetical protein
MFEPITASLPIFAVLAMIMLASVLGWLNRVLESLTLG